MWPMGHVPIKMSKINVVVIKGGCCSMCSEVVLQPTQWAVGSIGSLGVDIAP